MLLGEPLQPQVLVHVLRLQILGQLAVLLDLVEELDLLFSLLFKLQVQGLDRLLALDEKHVAGRGTALVDVVRSEGLCGLKSLALDQLAIIELLMGAIRS